MLINQNYGFVGVHHRTRTKESAQVHQTFFSLEVGSENETVLHTDIEKKNGTILGMRLPPTTLMK